MPLQRWKQWGGLPGMNAIIDYVNSLSIGAVGSLLAAPVTNSSLQDMAQSTIKGRAASAGTGDPTDLTADQVSTILDSAADPFVRTSAVASGGVYGAYTDLLSASKLGGKTYSSKLEYAALGTSATVTILDTSASSAAGYVDSLFVAIQATSNVVRGESLIKVYIDGAGSPDITVRVDQLAGAVYFDSGGTVKAFTSKYIGCNTASNQKSYFFNLPIPFATSVKITLTNASASVAGTVWAVASYKTGISNTWSRTRRLRVDSGTGDAAPNATVTLTNQAGKGRYVGMWLLVDGFPGSNSPRLASLEGNIKFYIDSDVSPTYESSGTEDYFLQGFYFNNAQVPTNSPNVGVAWKDSNSVSAYRFHPEDPWTFDTNLKITWNAGDTSQVSFTGNVRYYYTVWYYTE